MMYICSSPAHMWIKMKSFIQHKDQVGDIKGIRNLGSLIQIADLQLGCLECWGIKIIRPAFILIPYQPFTVSPTNLIDDNVEMSRYHAMNIVKGVRRLQKVNTGPSKLPWRIPSLMGFLALIAFSTHILNVWILNWAKSFFKSKIIIFFL